MDHHPAVGKTGLVVPGAFDEATLVSDDRASRFPTVDLVICRANNPPHSRRSRS